MGDTDEQIAAATKAYLGSTYVRYQIELERQQNQEVLSSPSLTAARNENAWSGATLLETLCVLHCYSLGLQMCHVFSGALIPGHRECGL